MTDKQPSADDIWDSMAGEHVCMFVTLEGSAVKMRPMAPMLSREEGCIWFMTDRTSKKVRDIDDDAPVTLSFQNSAKNTYLAVSGPVSVVDDRTQIAKLWNPMLKQWFDGPEDPRIVLLGFQPTEADYWIGPNQVVSGLKMLFTAATGVRTDVGDAGKVVM